MAGFVHLLPPSWKSYIPQWIAEDVPSLDYGGFVVGDKPTEAHLFCKADGILAGVPFVTEIFSHLGCSVDWLAKDGDTLALLGDSKMCVAIVKGPACRVLLGERVALNTLARCSGIATSAAKLNAACKATGWKGTLAGTRKTTPGFRLVEKYALIVAGVDPHRYDLSSMCMLKDNHIWSKGSITEAVSSAKRVCGFSIKVHVECRSLDEAKEAAAAGADMIMLDNFTPEQARNAAGALDVFLIGRTRPLIEISGGITPENAGSFCIEGVDVLSTSAIHQGTPIIDFSLKVQP